MHPDGRLGSWRANRRLPAWSHMHSAGIPFLDRSKDRNQLETKHKEILIEKHTERHTKRKRKEKREQKHGDTVDIETSGILFSGNVNFTGSFPLPTAARRCFCGAPGWFQTFAEDNADWTPDRPSTCCSLCAWTAGRSHDAFCSARGLEGAVQ